MNVLQAQTTIAASGNQDPDRPASGPADGDLSPEQLQRRFVVMATLLSYDALRIKPREKQFGLMLASESFARGKASGPVGISFPVRGKLQTGRWCERFSSWKTTEVWKMFVAWRRDGWLSVDIAKGEFHLAPDKLPGWADALGLWQAESGAGHQVILGLNRDSDLQREVAKVSQAAAVPPDAENAKFSHTQFRQTENAEFSRSTGPPDPQYAKFSHTPPKYGGKKPHTQFRQAENAEFSHTFPPGSGGPGVPGAPFKRLTGPEEFKRSNVERLKEGTGGPGSTEPENAKISHTSESRSIEERFARLQQLSEKKVPQSGTPPPLLTRQEEHRLMEEIAFFFTDAWPLDRDVPGRSGDYPEEMMNSGAFWRTKCVRNFPAAVEEALGQARELFRQHGPAVFDDKRTWLNTHIRLYAGVRAWGDVPAGGKPLT